MRHYVRNAVHAVRPGTGAAELAQLIPELEIDPLPGPAPEDPETRRYLMFEAVSLLLSDACVRAPVLLVLDDLHWADRPTLQLLRHVLRAQDEAPLLIVGTYREGEGRRPSSSSCSPTCGATGCCTACRSAGSTSTAWPR